MNHGFVFPLPRPACPALGHPHTFFCRLELGSDREVPDTLQKHLEVEFDMPAASASKATVRSLSVGERTDVKKWVNYRSHYSYQVPGCVCAGLGQFRQGREIVHVGCMSYLVYRVLKKGSVLGMG